MTESAMASEALRAGATLSQLFMCNPIFGGVTLTKCGSPEMKRDLLPTHRQSQLHYGPYRTLRRHRFHRLQDLCPRGRQRVASQLPKIWVTCLPQATTLLFVVRMRRLDEVQHGTDAVSLLIVDGAGLPHTAIEQMGTGTLTSSGVFCDDIRIEGAEPTGELAPVTEKIGAERRGAARLRYAAIPLTPMHDYRFTPARSPCGTLAPLPHLIAGHDASLLAGKPR